MQHRNTRAQLFCPKPSSVIDRRLTHSAEQTSARSHQLACSPVAGTCYRANLPIMVLAFRDNHEAAVTIRVGEVFEVVGPAQDDRFIVVKVRGEEMLVFESDPKDRGEIVHLGQANVA